MPLEIVLLLAPTYRADLALVGGGQTLTIAAPAAPLPVELFPVLTGPQGLPGSSLQAAVAANSISGHVATTLNSEGLAIPADCRIAAHAAGVLGVTTGAVVQGAYAQISNGGFLESSGWGLTPDLPIYLGESGAVVQVLPPSAIFVKVLGRALSPSAVLIEIQPAIFIN